MQITTKFPRIRHVECGEGRTLLVTFENGSTVKYDCTPLLESEAFRPLQNESFFRLAHADPHGYGVVWDDKIDLSEGEIWTNGKMIRPD